MAVNPRDIPVTREEVHEWLQEYQGQVRSTKRMAEFIDEKLRDKEIDPAQLVNATANDSLQDETTVLDMILMDIESYG